MHRHYENVHPLVRLAALLATVLSLVVIGSALAQQDPPPAERSLKAASYPVFALGSDVEVATIQVTEGAPESGARIVVSLHDPLAFRDARAVLYVGDCGPDREIALELTAFDVDDDPLSSVTQDPSWTVERLTDSDLFAYLFADDVIDRPTTEGLDGDVLGCGEVGLGANRASQ